MKYRDIHFTIHCITHISPNVVIRLPCRTDPSGLPQSFILPMWIFVTALRRIQCRTAQMNNLTRYCSFLYPFSRQSSLRSFYQHCVSLSMKEYMLIRHSEVERKTVFKILRYMPAADIDIDSCKIGCMKKTSHYHHRVDNNDN